MSALLEAVVPFGTTENGIRFGILMMVLYDMAWDLTSVFFFFLGGTGDLTQGA